jgi:pyruvate,water dikinase
VTPALVLDLREIDDAAAPLVGGKAASLGRLMRAGLPVPDGFCLTAAAYLAHVAPPAAPQDGPEQPHDLRRVILERPLDPALRDQIDRRMAALRAGAVAVRSSATAEDLAHASFAGQYDSFLNVAPAECAECVRRCWASLWSERAVAYRNRLGLAPPGLAMGVVVQTLVAARVSGVLFTDDGDGRMLLECAAGLGDAVVSGRVAPRRLTVQRQPPHDTAHDPHPLSRQALGHLATLARAAERGFGRPLDIEWSVDDAGRVWLLQARPITARPIAAAAAAGTQPDASPPASRPRQFWTNANAGEVVPDVVTPMTASLIEPVVREMLGVMAWHLGVELGDLPLLSFFAGRVYFNLNTITAFLRASRATRGRSVEEFLGGLHAALPGGEPLRIPESDLPAIRVSRWRLLQRGPLLLARLLAHRPGGAERHVLAMRRRTLADLSADRARLSVAELLQRIDAEIDDLGGDVDTFLYVAVGLLYSMGLYQGCPGWFGADGAALLARLLAGSGALEHAEAGTALWGLARRARASASLEALLRSSSTFDAFAPAAAALPGGDAFLRAWRSFMLRHGHHARGEIELGTPRWAEQPDLVLAMVRSQLEGLQRIDPARRAAELADDRRRAADECRRHLRRRPLRRMAFGLALRLARRGLPVRENIKNELVRRLYLLRLLLLELGRRLSARGTIEGQGDVFFLGRDELPAAVAGDARLRAVVAARAAQHEHHRTLRPPSVFAGDFDPAAAAPAPRPARPARLLRGLGVCPGVAAGPARVIHHAEGGALKPGEILVAPFTDPGWTPYFLNAAAIVVDMGGILSHGSIVARELGVPCVVNVGPASATVRDGQRLRVDGAAGTVELCDESG